MLDDRPEILSLTYSNATGQVSLVYRGLACVQYAIQSSTNLTDWIDRTNQTGTLDGLFQWTDDNPQNLPACFYRIMQP